MKALSTTFAAELLKLKRSKIVWVTFVAFALAPLMGAVFMLILNSPEAMEKATMLSAKAQAMGFTSDWAAYFTMLSQAVGVGGGIIFGFVASWIFGREYSDGTAKDILSLPTSRATILTAKFGVYALWAIALAISNLIVGAILGTLLGLPGIAFDLVLGLLSTYFLTAFLTILLGTPIAFMAIWGKGYMAPLGFLVLTIVFAQLIAAMGYGAYFPWAVPGLFSGAAGEYREQLTATSYGILFLTAAIGYISTLLYWRNSDQI